MRPALFAGELVTDVSNNRYEETYRSVGGQIDFEFTAAHRLPLTLSIGYAQGYIDREKVGDEWMLSLRLL